MTKKVTLVYNVIAKKGRKFIPINKSNVCDECSVKNACIDNIDMGRLYKITDIRSKTHKCPITGEKVRVVEVTEPSLKLVTEINNEFVGSVKSFNPPNCDYDECNYKELCTNPPGIKKGNLLEITDISKKIDCKKRKRMFLIQAKRKS